MTFYFRILPTIEIKKNMRVFRKSQLAIMVISLFQVGCSNEEQVVISEIEDEAACIAIIDDLGSFPSPTSSANRSVLIESDETFYDMASPVIRVDGNSNTIELNSGQQIRVSFSFGAVCENHYPRWSNQSFTFALSDGTSEVGILTSGISLVHEGDGFFKTDFSAVVPSIETCLLSDDIRIVFRRDEGYFFYYYSRSIILNNGNGAIADNGAISFPVDEAYLSFASESSINVPIQWETSSFVASEGLQLQVVVDNEIVEDLNVPNSGEYVYNQSSGDVTVEIVDLAACEYSMVGFTVWTGKGITNPKSGEFYVDGSVNLRWNEEFFGNASSVNIKMWVNGILDRNFNTSNDGIQGIGPDDGTVKITISGGGNSDTITFTNYVD